MLGGSWAAGMMMHVVNGSLIFPAVYAYALYDRVPGSPAIKGTAWGVALWLMAQVIVMPMMGGGLFSSNMGGLMAAMGSRVGPRPLWQPARHHRQRSPNRDSPTPDAAHVSRRLSLVIVSNGMLRVAGRTSPTTPRQVARQLEKDRAICVCTHLGLDLRADIIAAQGFAEFFADPTGRAAEASAIDRYAVFPRVTDQIDQRWQSDALNILRNRRV